MYMSRSHVLGANSVISAANPLADPDAPDATIRHHKAESALAAHAGMREPAGLQACNIKALQLSQLQL